MTDDFVSRVLASQVAMADSSTIRVVTKSYFYYALSRGIKIENEGRLVQYFSAIERGDPWDDFLPSWYCENQYSTEQHRFLQKIGADCTN